MHIQKISSLQHPLVKHCLAVRKDASSRTASGQCLVLGKTMLQELASQKDLLKTLLVVDGQDAAGIKAQEIVYVTTEIMHKITGLADCDGYAALARLPQEADLSACRYVVALDKLSDPGNVGTLFRNALALGWHGLILLEGGCDPFNDKALRSGKGAQFFLPFTTMNQTQFLTFIKQGAFQVIGACLTGTNLAALTIHQPCILMLGHETRGITSQGVQYHVTIPMQASSDSLNVASAGAILLYTLRHQP